jgi:hypothetical protein
MVTWATNGLKRCKLFLRAADNHCRVNETPLVSVPNQQALGARSGPVQCSLKELRRRQLDAARLAMYAQRSVAAFWDRTRRPGRSPERCDPVYAKCRRPATNGCTRPSGTAIAASFTSVWERSSLTPAGCSFEGRGYPPSRRSRSTRQRGTMPRRAGRFRC